MTDNLQKIIEACHKTNPQLLELSFGCKIIWKAIYDDKKEEAIIYKIYSKPKRLATDTKFIGECIVLGEDSYTAFSQENIVEIIGHDIILEDVLMTIQEARGNKFIVQEFCITQSTHEDIVEENQHLIWGLWQFKKPLHLQRQETINFIASLL